MHLNRNLGTREGEPEQKKQLDIYEIAFPRMRSLLACTLVTYLIMKLIHTSDPEKLCKNGHQFIETSRLPILL